MFPHKSIWTLIWITSRGLSGQTSLTTELSGDHPRELSSQLQSPPKPASKHHHHWVINTVRSEMRDCCWYNDLQNSVTQVTTRDNITVRHSDTITHSDGEFSSSCKFLEFLKTFLLLRSNHLNSWTGTVSQLSSSNSTNTFCWLQLGVHWQMDKRLNCSSLCNIGMKHPDIIESLLCPLSFLTDQHQQQTAMFK